MDECNLHTILRLPTGIFYAQGVKTNVIFFNKAVSGASSTTEIWIYDLRTNMPAFGRMNPLGPERFEGFIAAYGTAPNGGSSRLDEGVTGRFRKFTREEIRSREENLDITWLRDEEEEPDADLVEPEDLTAAIAGHLRSALAEIDSIAEEVELDAINDIVGAGPE